MKVLETARITDIVFHGTTTDRAISILKQNQFNLAFSKIPAEDELSPSNKYHFFLSTARSKTSQYLSGGSQPCIFVLDGRKLGQRYSGKAVNYWNKLGSGDFKDEKEDRVFSKDAFIPNASSYIKEIQIHLQDVTKDRLKTLMSYAKRRNIPVKVFNTFKGLLLNKKSDLATSEQIEQFLKDSKIKHTLRNPAVKPEDLQVFTYGYSVLEEAIQKSKSFYEILKSRRYKQTKMYKRVQSTYLLDRIAPYRYSDFGLVWLMSDARRGATPEITNEVQKISRLMRSLRVNSLQELHAKFVEKKNELEKILAKKREKEKYNTLFKEVSKIIQSEMKVDTESFFSSFTFFNCRFKTQNQERIKQTLEVVKRRVFFLLGADYLIFIFSTPPSSKLRELLISEGFTDYGNEYQLSNVKYETLRNAQIASDLEHQETLKRTGFWGKQGAGCIVFAKDTKRFLIGHRSRFVEQPNTWGTFGGAVDSNESPQLAVKRELKEETGYTGPSVLKKVYTFKHSNGFTFHNFIAVVPKEFTPKLNWENQDCEWVSFGDWPEPLHFGLQGILKDRNSISVMKSLSGEK